MKNIVLLIALSCIAVLNVKADIPGVFISTPEISKEQDMVRVKFRAEIGDKTVKSDYSLVFAPEITDGKYTWSLPAIVVQGKRAKKMYERQVMISENMLTYEDAIFVSNGEDVLYEASIPYQDWMKGAKLAMNAINTGCCSSSTMYEKTMVENIKLQPEALLIRMEPVEAIPIPISSQLLSTADKLAENHSYLIPIDKYQPVSLQIDYSDDRENALKVNFRQGKSLIEERFNYNGEILEQLLESIREIENSQDSKIRAVTIAGFASPEGSAQFNKELSMNRALSLKSYILANSNLHDYDIKIYNGAEDWQGLRKLVEESQMQHKAEIINIIDNVPVWDNRKGVGRLGELMRLDGGRPYRYMLEYLFPQLRNAAYIKIYYQNY